MDKQLNEITIEKIGVQLYWVEVGCYKHVRAAVKHIEAQGMAVMAVTPLMDYDLGVDAALTLRAVIITVAFEARESLRIAG